MSADATKQTALDQYGQIYVSSTGKVGIGTTSPAAKLDVNGTAKILAWHDQQVSTDGYTWVGNILFQWGSAYSTDDGPQWFNFPVVFPNQCFTVSATLPGSLGVSQSNFSLDRLNEYDGTLGFTYMAIGY